MDASAGLIGWVLLAAQGEGGGIDPALGVIVAAVLSTIAAVIASWLTSRTAGRASRDSAVLQWAAQMQANEQAARAEAQQSRERADRIKVQADENVDKLRAKLDALEAQLDNATEAAAKLTDKLTMAQAEVWRPEPDLDALRRLLGRPQSGTNGRTW